MDGRRALRFTGWARAVCSREAHGTLANNTAILEDSSLRDFPVVVEAKIEHSKTGYSRYLNMAGTTKTSGIQVGKHVQEYWRLAGFALEVSMQAGVKVTRPDFWVARVSLLGMEEKPGLRSLLAALKECRLSNVQEHLRSSEKYAKARYMASGASSGEKKFVNVAGGRRSDPELAQVVSYMRQRGFTAHLVPGPLLLATTGGKAPRPTLMPFSTSSASTPVKKMLMAAYEKANQDPADPDPHIDLQAGKAPKFSTHSLRREADTAARRLRVKSETTEPEIDIYFGWNERVLLKAMQVHYENLSIRARMALAKITGWL